MGQVYELLSQLDEPFTGEVLFDHLSNVVFFIKDDQGRYLVANHTLATRCGLASKQDLVGRTASEVLRPPLGDRFTDQDQQVLKTGCPLLSQLELHIHASRDVGWCITTKLPLKKSRGKVIGVVGVSQDLKLPDYEAEEYKHVATAIEFAEAHLSERPSVEQLADIAGMSRYQLDRRMRHIFGLTTGQWMVKMRIDLAQRLLSETENAIAAIALESGYSDQSAFTRQFRRATGLSPREYRLTRTQT